MSYKNFSSSAALLSENRLMQNNRCRDESYFYHYQQMYAENLTVENQDFKSDEIKTVKHKGGTMNSSAKKELATMRETLSQKGGILGEV